MEDPPPLLFPFFESINVLALMMIKLIRLSLPLIQSAILLDNLLSQSTLKSFWITFPYFNSVFHQTSESSDDESIFCNDHVFIRLAKFPNQGFENF